MNYSDFPKEIRSIIKPPVWNSWYYINISLRKVYEKSIQSILKNNIKYSILDYGCGAKPYKYLFNNHIEKYVGVDVGNNPHADYLIEPGQDLPIEDNEFDIVVSSQVLEHVENVPQYLKEVKRVLKPQGILLLSTHGTWQFHSSPYDYYRWTSMGLKNLLTKSGFQITSFIPIMGQLAVTSQLRLTFYDSFANMAGILGKIILAPLSLLYQFKMWFEDKITPKKVKERDSAIYVIISINNK
jgi:SAM-dependent methyltransferase